MEKDDVWSQTTEVPAMFELRMPLGDKVFVVERTLDENAARVAFDACRKVLTQLTPRPEVCVELLFANVPLDVFEQTREGAEAEPTS